MSNVSTTLEGPILRITIDRPDKKNAITAAMYAALATALRAGDADKTVRAMVIHGAGDAFCAGNDLQDFLANPPRDERDPVLGFLTYLGEIQKPFIAAVHGAAAGVGTTMLLHCDFVYATEKTRFVLPFVNLGIVPEAGSSYLLPRLAGYQRAAELLLLGEPFDAAKAREIGLVNAIVPPERLLETAMATAQKIAERPAAAIRATKALMRRWQGDTMRVALAEEIRQFAARLHSPEAKEAFSAFIEKRKPDFSKFE